MRLFFKFYIFIYMIMSIGFTQETLTLTEEQVTNLYNEITTLQTTDSLNTNYIKLLETQQAEQLLLIGDFKLKIENLDKQILLQEERIKEISPKWYENKWLWFGLGIVTTSGAIHLAGQISD